MAFFENGNRRSIDWGDHRATERVTYVRTVQQNTATIRTVFVLITAATFLFLALIVGGADAMETCLRNASADTCHHTLR